MHKALATLAVTALATTLSAQSVAVPNGMATTHTGISSFTWRNTAFRFQMLYDTSHFTAQSLNSPVSISRLQFRATDNAVSAGGETYSGVTVQMSSSPLDWNSASTTFANNRGTDLMTVFNGNIVCLAAAGTSPNTYIIDVVLNTPFVYDPSQGLDLCIEVDAPVPVPTGVPNMACSSSTAHLARRISASSQAATTGSLSSFASVVLIDYTVIPNAATAVKYGSGCNDLASSWYEDVAVGGFDLSNSSILMTPTGSGHAVTPGSNNWYTPISPDLALGDDTLSAAQPLGFTFNYPGGSTTDIKICSNGFVWLDTTQTLSTFSGGGGTLCAQAARVAQLWNDLDPTAGGTVHFDVDPSGNIAYATWVGVPRWNVLPQELCNMQTAFFSDGSIEMRYQTCQNGVGCFGFSPAPSARDPGSRDVSATMPFVTLPDTFPLALDALNRPRMGQTLSLETSAIPGTAVFGATILSFAQHNPGINLTSIGMPGCFQHVNLDAIAVFIPAGSTALYQIGIPVHPSWAGAHVFAQSMVLDPAANALGAESSNGIDLLLDIN